MATDRVEVGAGSWPTPLGSVRNDRLAAVPAGGLDRVRWSVELPGSGADAISVGGDGTVYVSTPDALLAVRGGTIAWTAPAVSFGGCVVLGSGLLVASEPSGLAVRRQGDGGLERLIAAPRRTLPTVVAGRLVFVQADGRGRCDVRAVGPDGAVAWTAPLERPAWFPPLALGSRVAVADGEALLVLDGEDGGVAWRHRGRPGPGWSGPLIGLQDGRVLAQYEATGETATLIADPTRSAVETVPAHLPLNRPMATTGDRLALPGWEVEDASRPPQPVLYVVELRGGRLAHRVPTPTPVVSVAATADGAIAYAASPSLEAWTQQRGFPGSEEVTRCAVGLLRDGGGMDLTVPAPVTGPIAIGAAGDLIVPVAGRLLSIGGA